MKIVLIVEGQTERVFKDALLRFLQPLLAGRMPRIETRIYHGLIPKGDDLRQRVESLLCGPRRADEVIALTDVYTGGRDFVDAADAKAKMSRWVGNTRNFHPHAAQYEFEAWLLPYWDTVQRLAGHNMKAPAGAPETIDHGKPPSRWIREIYSKGTCRNHYNKPRDARRILARNNLLVAAQQCPELKALLNTILTRCGGQTIP